MTPKPESIANTPENEEFLSIPTDNDNAEENINVRNKLAYDQLQNCLQRWGALSPENMKELIRLTFQGSDLTYTTACAKGDVK